MTLWSILERAERLHAGATAVVDGDARRTWRDIARRARRLAGWLQRTLPDARTEDGAGPRVAILSRNREEFLTSYFAAAGAGAVLVPLNTRSSAHDVTTVLEHSGAALWILDPACAGIANDVSTSIPRLMMAARPDERAPFEAAIGGAPTLESPAAVAPDAPAQLYYTSGTTGTPKGVILTHGNVMQHALMTIGELGLGDDECWAHVAPMFHLADAWATFAITWVGGRHVMQREFEPAATLDLFVSEGVTLTNLVPTMLNLMVKQDGADAMRFPRLRRILSGGAPIAPDVVRRITDVFGSGGACEYVQTYGMTETAPFLTMSLLSAELRRLPPAEQLVWRAKTGRPVLGVELRVVAPDGRAVDANDEDVGEIQVRGPTVTPGYWRDEDATRAAFTTDGFLRTGDLARVDSRGYVSIVDRSKDVILTGGETVYSTEVEARLYEHPDVLEAAVFGRPDATWGEVVCAAVVPRPGRDLDVDALRAFCREHLAGFRTPKHVELVDALPRTGSGKIAKRLLRG